VDFSALLDDTRVPVIDNLTSTETTSALSANQGRVLDDKIGAMLEYPSIRPSLLLDFYSKEIDPRITFSRASNKSYYDHKGRLCYADVDEPTIDHDPVTGECKGLSIWESRTNLLAYSEDFGNGVWIRYNSTIEPNTAVAPDGTMTADKLVANTDNSEHYMEQILTQTEGTFTKSLYVKKGNSGDYVVIRPVHIGEISPTSIITFDLNVGPRTTTNGLITNAGMDILLDGWRRCWVTYTTTAACTYHGARVQLTNFADDNLIYTGDGTSGIYIWGAQLEEGSSPSPYIPTLDTPVTRAADVAYIDGEDFAEFYNQNEGSVVVEFDTNNSSGNNRILAFSDSILTNNSLFITTSLAHDNVGMQQFSEGSFITKKFVYTDVVGKLLVGAMYQEDLMQVAVDGGVAGNPVSGVKVPTNVDRLTIGYTVTSNIPLNGHIRHLAYYPKALTDNNLIALTTEE
jgi:hypothetical protein